MLPLVQSQGWNSLPHGLLECTGVDSILGSAWGLASRVSSSHQGFLPASALLPLPGLWCSMRAVQDGSPTPRLLEKGEAGWPGPTGHLQCTRVPVDILRPGFTPKQPGQKHA